MFKKNYIVKINLPGGIVAAGDLYAIADAATRARVEDMQFGARQQLFCKVADRYGETFLRELDGAGIFYETEKERYPNIISSYVSEGVFGRSAWLSEGLYKDILEGFDFRPRLKINLVEDGQSFVPFFTGHLNFISSSLNNHWHLHVRLPGTNRLFQWKTVIYSPDIPRISRLIEEALLPAPAAPDAPGAPTALTPATAPSPEQWFHQLYEQVAASFAHNPAPPPLRLPSTGVPYYEGFNLTGSKHWLGIYRREELFAPDFLKEVCLLALHTKIGQLYTTPWKSLLIKGIEAGDVNRWEYILGKYRINVRHASNELNWQTEDLNPEGLRLKRYLIRQLDQDDVRTQGLTFAIKMQQGSGLPGSIVIRKSENPKAKKLDRYSIWHTPDFDPYTMETVLYREDLEKETLYPYIVSLCKEFYRRQSEHPSPAPADLAPPSSQHDPEKNDYHCIHCLTAYSQEYGDPDRDIQPGTPFEALPQHWSCPVCDAPKSDYRTQDLSLLA